ncbi:MAG TPA: M13 family metallopeptidase [Puia sp.]|jgi:putative endopeptidase
MKIHFLPALFAVAGIAMLPSCQTPAKETPPDFLARNLDTSTTAANDFFEYANGGWIRQNAIPPAESSWGIGELVQEDLYDRLRKINEKAAAEKAANGTPTQQIGDLWISGMDSAATERMGLKPLQPDLDAIAAIRNRTDLLRVTAALHQKSINSLFSDYVGQDDKYSDQMAYQLGQGGLGMPNRDYYFNTDPKSTRVREAYRHYLTVTFRQLGKDSLAAGKQADAVFQLESRLAKASRKLAALRDPNKNYNKLSKAALQSLTPLISWEEWFKNSGITHVDSIIVGQPEFYTALNTELAKTDIADWKSYLQAHLLQNAAPFLDSVTYANYFAYRQSLTGTTTPRIRWRRVLDAEERAMGEALGQLFVKEYFPAKAKQRYSDLVEAIRTAYKERIQKLTWMSDSTKQKALYKLAHITKKVGYPDKWKDFSALSIDRGPFVLNMQRAAAWWHHYNFNKLGKPVDRSEWGMSPQTYNAYYNPSNNEIVLPAGMFSVPGKKDEDLDDAFVYGYAAASTIGHEMTHGFDDEGRQYDDKGNLRNWWQPSDETKFKDKAAFIIREFSGFSPVDTLHINGEATQGENIADLGGLLLGLDAFKKTEAYKKGEKIGGLTPLQRYFLGYAYSWMYQERKEVLASQLMTDVHAPAKERVNGPVMNIPEFYEAFGIKPGDKMYRPDSLRVNIW